MEQNNHEDLNIRLLIAIGVTVALLLAEVVVVTQGYFYNAQEEEFIAKQMSQPLRELTELVAGQQADLNSYRWVDRGKKRVSVPIEVAIKNFVHIEQQRAATRPKD